jgi:Tfp pilus assembly protein PilO
MDRPVFILIFIYLAIALIGWAFFWPAWQITANQMAELKEWQEKMALAQDVWGRIKAQSVGFSGGEAKENVLEAMPASEDEASLLVQLEALSSQNGLILSSVGFSSEENAVSAAGQTAAAASAAKEMKISLVLAGGFPEFRNFLQAAEKNLRLLDLVSANFSSEQGTGEGAWRDEFNVDLKTYYLKK